MHSIIVVSFIVDENVPHRPQQNTFAKTFSYRDREADARDPHYFAALYSKISQRQTEAFLAELKRLIERAQRAEVRLFVAHHLQTFLQRNLRKLGYEIVSLDTQDVASVSNLEGSWRRDVASSTEPSFDLDEIGPFQYFTVVKVEENNVTTKILALNIETDELSAGIFEVDANGTVALIEKSKRFTTDFAEVNDLANYKQRIATFLNDYQIESEYPFTDIQGIAVIHTGDVDEDAVVIRDAGRFGLRNVNIREILSEITGIENVRAYHDVASLAVGEMQYGVGQEYSNAENYFLFNVGTGVGGAIFMYGKHVKGVSLTAGEIGHTIVNRDGRECPVCLRSGCLEVYASRYYINEKVIQLYQADRRNAQRQRPITSLGRTIASIQDPWGISLKMLAHAVNEEKDPNAKEAISYAAKWLGYGIANVIDLLNPSVVIMAGVLMDGIPLYFEEATRWAEESSLPEAWVATKILRASKGKDAFLWGGAAQFAASSKRNG